jgi:hypothetical protein
MWKATRWAIHDETKFAHLIKDVKELVSGLLQITETLDSVERNCSKLQEEIEKISDLESLLIWKRQRMTIFSCFILCLSLISVVLVYADSRSSHGDRLFRCVVC